MWNIFKKNPKTIEAHQAALVATTIALDLAWEGNRPTKIADERRWPRFGEYLQEDSPDRTKANCDLINAEQIYLQAFAFEQALKTVHTVNIRLAEIVLDAWDYYLSTLPQEHGIAFDYQIWSQRRATYLKAWNEAAERRQKNSDMVKNPFFPLTMAFFEDVCHIGPHGVPVLLISLKLSHKIDGFVAEFDGLVIDRE